MLNNINILNARAFYHSAMLKIGIIGFGKLGGIHANNVSKSKKAFVAAICDLDEDKLENAKSLYQCATFNNVRDFFNFGLDGVVIASSTPEHLKHIQEASKHRIAIFTEKPVGLTMEETDNVLSTISQANITFQIGFQRRWDDRFIKAKELLGSGKIGQPLMYKAYGRDPDASNPVNWGIDKNGGLFLNAAIHDYDAARFILGQEISQVSAIGAVVHHKALKDYDDYDTAITTMLTKEGIVINTEWSRYATYGYDIGLEIIGTDGIIKISQNNIENFSVIQKNDKAPAVTDVFAKSYRNQIDAFIASIIENTLPSPGIEDARIALNLAITARESANNNGALLSPSEITNLS